MNVTITKGQQRLFSGLLTGYAYETIPNKPIIAGKTKGADDIENRFVQPNPASVNAPTGEPAALGLLAMGAPGLSIWRRELVDDLP